MNLGFQNEVIEFSSLAYYGKAHRSDDQYNYLNKRQSFKHNEASAGIESALFVMNTKIKKNTELKAMFSFYRNSQVLDFETAPPAGAPDPGNNIFASVDEGILARGFIINSPISLLNYLINLS